MHLSTPTLNSLIPTPVVNSSVKLLIAYSIMIIFLAACVFICYWIECCFSNFDSYKLRFWTIQENLAIKISNEKATQDFESSSSYNQTTPLKTNETKFLTISMSNYSVKFYAESIKCEEDECNFTINNTTCISNSEDLFRDIWICENPKSKGLITAKIKCGENEITPGNACYLRYRFNVPVPVASPDTRVHPPPIFTDPTTEFLSNLFFFSIFGFFIITILVGFIRACLGDPSSGSSNCHPHPSSYTVVNGQGFCDNPDHFIANNNSDAPPPYEAINNGSNASTPLLPGNRSKHCIDPRCPNYLKPYLPRSGIYSQGYQSIPPPILVSNPGYDYYNHHGHHDHHSHHSHYGHHSNHHGHNNGFFHSHGHHGHNSHHDNSHHGHSSHHDYY